MPTKAAVFTLTSRRLPGFNAANIPAARPNTMPMKLAALPNRNVLAIASFNAGQTSLLPLMLRGQLKVTKFCNQLRYPKT